MCTQTYQKLILIEGVPNCVYSQDIPKSRFYRLVNGDQFTTAEKFYKDKFALVINLRSIQDKYTTAKGRKIVGTQEGVLLKIKKTTTTTNLNDHVYIVADRLVNFINRILHSVHY